MTGGSHALRAQALGWEAGWVSVAPPPPGVAGSPWMNVCEARRIEWEPARQRCQGAGCSVMVASSLEPACALRGGPLPVPGRPASPPPHGDQVPRAGPRPPVPAGPPAEWAPHGAGLRGLWVTPLGRGWSHSGRSVAAEQRAPGAGAGEGQEKMSPSRDSFRMHFRRHLQAEEKCFKGQRSPGPTKGGSAAGRMGRRGEGRGEVRVRSSLSLTWGSCFQSRR